jgi:dethiobiotin synthetase
MSILIAGIHTGIGKTLCSTIICEALGYDYFKPVQAGDLDHTDSMFVKRNISNKNCTIHPEAYRLKIAASPHYAAAEEGIEIMPGNIQLPYTNHPMVVETAGGIMSPLGPQYLMIDLIEELKLPVVLVSENYLGSINHTLMTFACLKSRRIAIQGIVFNGLENKASQDYILEHTELPFLFAIPKFELINAAVIHDFAATISIKL